MRLQLIDFSLNWAEELNDFGQKRIPCYFVIDFLGEKGKIFKDKDNDTFLFDFSGKNKKKLKTIQIIPQKIDYKIFQEGFETVQKALNRGDSYLTNLTFSTEIKINQTLQEIFDSARAKYKILYKKKWVCFSPEPFIQTRDNYIFTFPMKGTIDAEIPDAEKMLIENQKELAEHFTIVDLLRNDLSIISKDVKVNKFRYLERIEKHNGAILQASSEIQGKLNLDWQNQMGFMLKKLLPAGSISGAPKQKTIEIIQEAEKHNRGFYTGIAGYFDGENLNTAVMIRFIEYENGKFYFKSGGGITAKSISEEEYQEVQEKIYIPI